jgi:hypothetical protein
VLEVALHFEESEEPHRTRKVNEEIDVAVDAGLAPSRRAEESKGSDAKPGQLRPGALPASSVLPRARSWRVLSSSTPWPSRHSLHCHGG